MSNSVTEDLKRASRKVLGREGHRSPEQELVVQWLEHSGYMKRPSFQKDKVSGQMCPYSAAVCDGRRGLATELISMAESHPSMGESKPKVRK